VTREPVSKFVTAIGVTSCGTLGHVPPPPWSLRIHTTLAIFTFSRLLYLSINSCKFCLILCKPCPSLVAGSKCWWRHWSLRVIKSAMKWRRKCVIDALYRKVATTSLAMRSSHLPFYFSGSRWSAWEKRISGNNYVLSKKCILQLSYISVYFEHNFAVYTS